GPFRAITENIEKGQRAFEGFGLAVKQSVADTLKALSKEWGAKALGLMADGLAFLAFGMFKEAGLSFAAAAAYGAAAAATGIAGAAVQRGVNRRSGGAGGSEGRGSSAPRP